MVLPVLDRYSSVPYTAYYCEENIWKLCEWINNNYPSEIENCHVLFISNKYEMVPLWGQQLGHSERDHLVQWDYHVILIYYTENQPAQVYDFDCILPFPCSFKRYCSQVFRQDLIRCEFHYRFRVIPAQQYLSVFASDRSRMRNSDNSYIKPPPNYECIHTANEYNNLNKFISMDADEFPVGQVVDLTTVNAMFTTHE